MTCYLSGNVSVCAPDVQKLERKMLACPTCGKRRKMQLAHYAWYGASVVCLTRHEHRRLERERQVVVRGEHWQGGEMCERPFAPGWRKASVASALRRWAEARR